MIYMPINEETQSTRLLENSKYGHILYITEWLSNKSSSDSQLVDCNAEMNLIADSREKTMRNANSNI